MTDPGLTDLIAAHSEGDYGRFGCATCVCGWRGDDHPAHVALVVEQHTNGRREWPKTTPTGFTYERPTTYAELEHMIGHMVQSEIECWDEAERPPEPVWEMVGIAQQEVNRMAEEIAELKAKCDDSFGRNDQLAHRLRVRIGETRDARARAEKAEAELEKYHAEERRELEWDRFCAQQDVRCTECGLRYGERKDYTCPHIGEHKYDADELRAALEGEQQ